MSYIDSELTPGTKQLVDGDFYQINDMSDKSNLIINYIPQDIDDIGLRGLFAEHGEIIQAKVVRDKATKKSLGYGFVKFLNDDDALDAINKKNGFPFGHKKLKVSYARAPSDDIKNCKLYVTNLPKTYSDNDVVALFGQFGDIIECRLLKDRQSGINKGVAFVQYNVRMEASRAMGLNGHYIEGMDKPLVIKYAEDQQKKRDKRPQMLSISTRFQHEPYLFPGDRMPGNMLGGGKMMGGYSINNGPAYLPVAVAMPYGSYQIKYTNSPTNNQSHQNWYGQHHMQGMYEGLSPTGMMSPGLNLPYEQIEMMGSNSGYNPPQGPASTVFMTNPRDIATNNASYNSNAMVIVSRLPFHVDVAMLQDLFSPYGRILSVHIETDESSNTPTGRAYIQMESLAQAQSAIQALHGSNPLRSEGSGPLQVDFYGNGKPSRI